MTLLCTLGAMLASAWTHTTPAPIRPTNQRWTYDTGWSPM